MNFSPKTHLLTAFIACFALSLGAQVERHIPADAAFVIELNPANLNAKYELTNIREMGLWSFFTDGMRSELPPAMADKAISFIESPSQYGVNGMGKMYFFGRATDLESMRFGALIQLTDQKKAQAFLEEMAGEPLDVQTANGIQFSELDDDALLAWNNNIAFIGGAVEPYDFGEAVIEDVEIEIEVDENGEIIEDVEMEDDGTDELEMEDDGYDWEAAYEARKAKIATATKAWTMEVMNGFSNNISSVSGWQRAQQTADDASAFLNYEFVQKLNAENAESMEALEQFGMGDWNAAMSKMYDDTYLEMSFNFDDGAVRMSTDLFSNPAMNNIYEKSAGGAFHNKMLRFVDGENLLGFYHFNYDLNGIVEGIKDLVVQSTGERPAAFDLLEEGTELMGVKLNQKTVTEMITGDILVAINGIRMVEREVVEYDYDDDFNAIEKTVTKEVPMPIFSLVSHYDEDDQLENLFEVGQDMGFLAPDEAAFKVTAGDDLGFDLWVSMRDNMLLVSNDPMFKTKKGIKKGYRGKPVSANVLKMLNANLQTFYVDFEAGVDAANQMQAMDVMTGMAAGMLIQQFESFVIRGPRAGVKTAHADLLLNLTNKNENSLKSILEFAESMISTMGMGGSRG